MKSLVIQQNEREEARFAELSRDEIDMVSGGGPKTGLCAGGDACITVIGTDELRLACDC